MMMNDNYLFHTIKGGCVSKLNEKKSSFIAYVLKISSEEELKDHLQIIKKKHKDASHFPYAFRIVNFDGEKESFDVVERFSDDGEPSRTAGYPLLRVLQKNDLFGVLLIVARVFGGIKLGPSGLMRAFSKSADDALEKTTIIEREFFLSRKFTTDIFHFQKLEVYLKQQNIVFKSEFDLTNVDLYVEIPFSKKDLLVEIKRLL